MGGGSGKLWFPLAAIVLLIPFVLGMKAWLFDKPSGKYALTIEFKDASGLIKNSHVKIGGVEAGQIERLDLDKKRDVAVANVSLHDGVGGIGAGARADARPVNLLGEKYIDLVVGDLKKPQKSGTKIPISSTSTPIELDDFLNMLDPGVRARVRILVNEAGIGLAGRGADFNGLLEELPPAIDQVGQLVAEVDAENRRMAQLIEQGDRVLTAFTPRRDDLGELVESAGDALEVTTSRRVELANTLKTAPPALTQLRGSLQELDTTAQAIRPAAVDLRRAAEPLTGTLKELPAFADASKETLRAARAAAPELTELGKDATPTIKKLRDTGLELDRFFVDADEVIRYMSEGNVLDQAVGFFQSWQNAIQREDGLNRLFGVRAYIDRTAIVSLIENRLNSPIPLPLGSAADKKGKNKDNKDKGEDVLPLPELPELPELPKPPGVKNAQQPPQSPVPVPGLSSGSQPGLRDRSGDTTRLFDYLFGS